MWKHFIYSTNFITPTAQLIQWHYHITYCQLKYRYQVARLNSSNFTPSQIKISLHKKIGIMHKNKVIWNIPQYLKFISRNLRAKIRKKTELNNHERDLYLHNKPSSSPPVIISVIEIQSLKITLVNMRDSAILFASASTCIKYSSKFRYLPDFLWMYNDGRSIHITNLKGGKSKTSSSLRSCCLVWERTRDRARFRSISCEKLYGSYIKEKEPGVTKTTL